MANLHLDEEKQSKLFSLFNYKKRLILDYVLMVSGLATFIIFLTGLAMLSEGESAGIPILLFGVMALGVSVYAIFASHSLRKNMLDGKAAEEIIQETLETVRKRAFKKLMVDNDYLQANSKLIVSPKFFDRNGLDLFFTMDKNGRIFCSLLQIYLLGVTKKHLSIYKAVLNLQNGEVYNEETNEWFLEDILAIKTVTSDFNDIKDGEIVGNSSKMDMDTSDKWSRAFSSNKGVFYIPIYQEPENGWLSKYFTQSSLKTWPINKSTEIDNIQISNKYNETLIIPLMSQEFAEQINATNVVDTTKVLNAVRSILRNKKS